MKTRVDNATVRLKQLFLPNITMTKIDRINPLPTRCKNRETTKLGAIRMSNDDIDELLEEIYRRDELQFLLRVKTNSVLRSDLYGDNVLSVLLGG